MAFIVRPLSARPNSYRPVRMNGAAGRTAGRVTAAVITMGASELLRVTNNAALSKDAQYRKAAAEADKYKHSYEKCKARRQKKGKKAWPQDKKSGLLTSNCKRDYQQWKKWEQKAADRAAELKQSLGKKGKLSADMENELNMAIGAPAGIAREEYEAEMADYNQKAQAQVQRGKSKEEIIDEMGPPPSPEDFTDTEDVSAFPLWVLGVAGVVVVGGVGYVVYRQSAQPKQHV